jgi:hypothetical protein
MKAWSLIGLLFAGAWVGRSIGEYADQRGLPSNTIDLGPGRAAKFSLMQYRRPAAINHGSTKCELVSYFADCHNYNAQSEPG